MPDRSRTAMIPVRTLLNAVRVMERRGARLSKTWMVGVVSASPFVRGCPLLK